MAQTLPQAITAPCGEPTYVANAVQRAVCVDQESCPAALAVPAVMPSQASTAPECGQLQHAAMVPDASLVPVAPDHSSSASSTCSPGHSADQSGASAATSPPSTNSSSTDSGEEQGTAETPARERTVYAVGIDSMLSERELITFLSSFGALVKARLCGNTTNRTVYGFFEYNTHKAAQHVVQSGRARLGRCIAHFSWAKSKIRDKRTEKGTRMRMLDLGNPAEPAAEPVPLRNSCLAENNFNTAWRRGTVPPSTESPASLRVLVSGAPGGETDKNKVKTVSVAIDPNGQHRVILPTRYDDSPTGHLSPGQSSCGPASSRWADDEEAMDFSVPIEVAMASLSRTPAATPMR